MGKIDRGIVSVNAYGLYQNITFPLLCKVFKEAAIASPLLSELGKGASLSAMQVLQGTNH